MHLMPELLRGLAIAAELCIGAALTPIVVMDSLLSLRFCLRFLPASTDNHRKAASFLDVRINRIACAPPTTASRICALTTSPAGWMSLRHEVETTSCIRGVLKEQVYNRPLNARIITWAEQGKEMCVCVSVRGVWIYADHFEINIGIRVKCCLQHPIRHFSRLNTGLGSCTDRQRECPRTTGILAKVLSSR